MFDFGFWVLLDFLLFLMLDLGFNFCLILDFAFDHFIEIEVETEVEPIKETNPSASDMEEWESELQMTEVAIQCLRQGLRSHDRAQVLACMVSCKEMRLALGYQ